MITYLLKSGLCLALLLAFYHLVLEREKMHTFNRFYLLGSILFSFLAPLYIIYIEATEVLETFVPTTTESFVFMTETPIEEPFNYAPYYFGFYALICLLMMFRFAKNLFHIVQKIRNNQHIKIDNATLVLVDDEISPHSFWNYIFVNKQQYFNEELENELYTHELTHVTQKHTLDIIIIELLQIVFWFNPMFYFIKKAIKLNHEFLADSSVINTYKNTKDYQYLLLNKSYKNEYYLASNLTYLLTKKRLQMMTKQSSRSILLLKKLAVIPLLTGFIFLFAERVEAVENSTENSNLPLLFSDEIKDTIQEKADYKSYFYKNGRITITDKNGKKITKKFSELTEEEKSKIPPPPPINSVKKVPSKSLLNKLKDKNTYAIWIDGKAVDNSILNSYTNTNFAYCSGSKAHKNARTKRFPQPYQFHLETQKYFDKKIEKRKRSFEDYQKHIKTVDKSNPQYHYTKQTFAERNNSGKKIVKKYYELSEKGKRKWLQFPPNVFEKKQISTAEFNKLKNSKLYVVRIDGIVIDNNKLNQSKPSDFASFSSTKISKWAKLPQEYHYNLLTKKGLELSKHFKKLTKKKFNKGGTQSFATDETLNDVKLKLEDIEKLTLMINDSISPKASQSSLDDYNRLAKKYNSQPKIGMKVKLREAQRIKHLYTKLSKQQKRNAEPYPDFPQPPASPTIKNGKNISGGSFVPPPPPKASQKTINEYNTLAKKYNGRPIKSRKIKVKDYNHLEGLYNQLSPQQKVNAEPYPKLPPPPPIDKIYSYQRMMYRLQKTDKNRKANLIYLENLYEKMNAKERKKVPHPSKVKSRKARIIKTSDNNTKITKEVVEVIVENDNNKINSKDIDVEEVIVEDVPFQAVSGSFTTNIETIYEQDVEVLEVIVENDNNKLNPNQKGSNLEEIIEEQNNSSRTKKLKRGQILINNKIYYFKKQNGKTQYFNLKGQEVDKNGNLISVKKVKKSLQQVVSIDKIDQLSNDEILSLPKRNLKNVIYFLNDKSIKKSELVKINHKKIKSINIKKNKKDEGRIYVYTN